MWSNGFSIDDGELRDYNDPANRAFLAAVMSGRIPEELIREARSGEAHVNMEDHKAEEYVKPKVIDYYRIASSLIRYIKTAILSVIMKGSIEKKWKLNITFNYEVSVILLVFLIS